MGVDLRSAGTEIGFLLKCGGELFSVPQKRRYVRRYRPIRPYDGEYPFVKILFIQFLIIIIRRSTIC
jgi:hypothetical protein